MNRPQTRRSPAATGLLDRTANTTSAHAIPSALLLPRLEGVITTGKGWRARCPVHGGKSTLILPSNRVSHNRGYELACLACLA